MRSIIIIYFLFISLTPAQTVHPLNFFPHHEGDIFEYIRPSTSEYFQNIIIKDSLGEDGKYYISMDSPLFNQWYVDTASYEVYGGNFLTLLEFKLDADSGDTWTVRRDSFLTERAEVIDVFPTILFGEDIIVKIIEYTDSASGLYFGSYWLASKFGIIREYGDPPWEPVYIMHGAKINNINHGTVTSIDNYANEAYPYIFTLNQNYPNPFNPTTSINWYLNVADNVRLVVYDILGNEILTLVDEFKPAGFNEVSFDGSGLTSGVYYYRLTNGIQSLTNKMVVLK
jgi:hypothetical protein